MTAAWPRDVPAPEPAVGVEAVLCGTDGVITDSAKTHAGAWMAAFDAFPTEHPPWDPARWRPFDSGEAARRLGAAPARTAVGEDAPVGGDAVRGAGFALGLGVDRTAGPNTRDGLLRQGADIVVPDLGELLGGGARR
ncbi:hypothetical protein [Streptomyces sp. NPDC002962]|uniref:hypothetical protein n=1 Tax=Streptomyces sp. NPDC002962 TaxID=3364674 RepID=UPI0036AF30C1